MEARNLEKLVKSATCPHETMGPRSMRYQSRPEANMVDDALMASFQQEIADVHALVTGIPRSSGILGNWTPWKLESVRSLIAGATTGVGIWLSMGTRNIELMAPSRTI